MSLFVAYFFVQELKNIFTFYYGNFHTYGKVEKTVQ